MTGERGCRRRHRSPSVPARRPAQTGAARCILGGPAKGATLGTIQRLCGLEGKGGYRGAVGDAAVVAGHRPPRGSRSQAGTARPGSGRTHRPARTSCPREEGFHSDVSQSGRVRDRDQSIPAVHCAAAPWCLLSSPAPLGPADGAARRGQPPVGRAALSGAGSVAAHHSPVPPAAPLYRSPAGAAPDPVRRPTRTFSSA